MIPYISVMDKLGWNEQFHIFSVTWWGSSSPLWCWNAAKVVCFLFKSKNLIPRRCLWSTKDSEPAADMNVPPGSVCCHLRTFLWLLQFACSTDLFLLYWEVILLFKKGWPLAWKEYWCIVMMTGTFSRRVGLFIFMPWCGRPTWQTSFFVPEVRWLPCSKVNLKKIFVIELEKKKIGLSFFLIFIEEDFVKDFSSDILRQLQISHESMFLPPLPLLYCIDRSSAVPTIAKEISSFSFPLQNTALHDQPLPHLNAFSLEGALEEEPGKSTNTVADFRKE